MFSLFSAFVLKIWGWKVSAYPHEVPKLVMAVAPHTSSWDFPVGIFVRSAVKANAVFVAKHTLFVPPFGWLLRMWGGIPVDRRQRGNFVAAVIDEFNKRDYFHVCIAPEGTRSKVHKFKSGFYHIAKGAGVPILLCTFDWGNMTVTFGELFQPTDDEAKDLEYIWNYYKGVKGRNPEKGIF